MADWDLYTIDHPTSGGFNGNEAELDDVYHIVHPQAASYILDEGRIRTGVVYDESRLNKSRTTVIWLSANLWSAGSIYGTVRFRFPWKKLIDGCQFYWVEAMAYSPPAYRILVTKNDYSHLGLTPYDPATHRGPLRSIGDSWYRNRNCTAEFMIDRDLELKECTSFHPEKHRENGCRIYKHGCRHLKTSQQETAGWMVSRILSHGVHAVDHTYTRIMEQSRGSSPKLSGEFDAGISGLFFMLGLHKPGCYKGAVTSELPAKAIVKGALSLLSADQVSEAREVIGLLDSYATFAQGLQELVEDHFGLSGWKIDP